MNLHVLRPASGDMMKLVKYDLVGGADALDEVPEIYHNHVLGVPDTENTDSDKADAIAEAGRTEGSVTDLGVMILAEGDSSAAIGAGVITAPISIQSKPTWLTFDNVSEGADVTVYCAANAVSANSVGEVTFNKGTTAYKLTVVVQNS